MIYRYLHVIKNKIVINYEQKKKKKKYDKCYGSDNTIQMTNNKILKISYLYRI